MANRSIARSAAGTIRSHFFTNRVINVWNGLPDNIVQAKTMNSFKSRLDLHWKDHPLALKYNFKAAVDGFT